AGAVAGLCPAGVQAGDRPDPPDPGPHGLPQPPHRRRYGLRPSQAGAGAGLPVPPRPGPDLPPPPDRRDHDPDLSPARLLHPAAGSPPPPDINITREPL